MPSMFGMCIRAAGAPSTLLLLASLTTLVQAQSSIALTALASASTQEEDVKPSRRSGAECAPPTPVASGDRFRHVANALDSIIDNEQWKASPDALVSSCFDVAYITIQYPAPVVLSAITVWHYYGDIRQYCSQSIDVSLYADFNEHDARIFECGTFDECGDTHADGRTVTLSTPRQVRFIRIGSSRNNRNPNVHILEVAPHITLDCDLEAEGQLNECAVPSFTPTVTGDRFSHVTNALDNVVDNAQWNTSPDAWVSSCSDIAYITLEYPQPVVVSAVTVYHYFGDQRQYCSQSIDVALTDDFSNTASSRIFQCVTYAQCGDTRPEGRTVHLSAPRLARFIRVGSSRNNRNNNVHILEIVPRIAPYHNCDADAICVDNDGSFTCICKAGYQGDGVSCADLNECTQTPPVPTVTGPRFSNSAAAVDGIIDNEQWKLSPVADVANNCDDVAYLTLEYPTPVVVTGVTVWHYYGDQRSYCSQSIDMSLTNDFLPVNEADERVFACREHAECGLSVPEGRVVTLPTPRRVRFIRVGSGMSVMNNNVHVLEIKPHLYNPGHGCDDPHAACTNTLGSYTCQCKTGYHEDGAESCTNVNECADGANVCAGQASQCTDTDGSFECTCDAGYRLIPEAREVAVSYCASSLYPNGGPTCSGTITVPPSAWNPSLTVRVQNLDGDSHSTLGDAIQYVRVNDRGTAFLHNLPPFQTAELCGSYQTVLRNFLLPAASGQAEVQLGMYDSVTQGLFNHVGICSESKRHVSLHLHTAQCADYDECAEGTHNCDGTHGTCTNTAGSFTCECKDGYQGDGTVCTNRDECDSGGLLVCGTTTGAAQCTDTEGSYTCACTHGFHQQKNYVKAFAADCQPEEGSGGKVCNAVITLPRWTWNPSLTITVQNIDSDSSGFVELIDSVMVNGDWAIFSNVKPKFSQDGVCGTGLYQTVVDRIPLPSAAYHPTATVRLAMRDDVAGPFQDHSQPCSDSSRHVRVTVYSDDCVAADGAQ